MKPKHLVLLAGVAATPLLAQETRELGAHVHGVSTLELAIEGDLLEMRLLSPGMDIVGFEYLASTDADKAAVDSAIRRLLAPESVVTLPEAAECHLTATAAGLQAEDHDAHGTEEDHAHEDHAKDEEHEHEHEHEHEEGAAHSAFHASYAFVCAHPEKLTAITFPFFDVFTNAQEIEAQYVTDAGAGAAEIARDSARLTLN